MTRPNKSNTNKKNCLFFAVFLVLSIFSAVTFAESMSSIDTKVFGFVGCGKISSAVARGYCMGLGTTLVRPKCIIVSPRNEEKSQRLLEDYPDLVTIAASNEDVVSSSDVLFIGLLPQVAREVLPQLPFRADQLVVSMMAAVDIEEVLTLVRIPRNRVVRTVPLPSNSQRTGPILVHPAGNTEVEALLAVIGKPVVCHTEAEMKPLISLTGHISSFFELQRRSQQWMIEQGVENETARSYVSSFYSSLASAAESNDETLGMSNLPPFPYTTLNPTLTYKSLLLPPR